MSAAEDCGCGPSVCAPRSLVHDTKLVQLLNSNQAALGRESRVDFGDLPAMVDGRFSHVTQIRIRAIVLMTNKAPSTAAAVIPMHAVRSLVYGVSLADRPNWRFLDKIDGRDVAEAEFFRHGRYLARQKASTKTIALHATVDQTGTSTLDLVIDLTSPDGSSERFIPVSALQAMGTDALRFSLRDDFNSIIRAAFGTGSDGHATAVYQLDGTTPGVEIWASTVELDAINHPPRWALRSQEYDATEGKLDHVDAAHTFAVMRNRIEDHAIDGTYLAGGETAPSLIDGGQFTVGGREVLSLPLSASARWTSRDQIVQGENMNSFVARDALFAGFGFPNVKLAESAADQGFRMILPYTDRKSAPAGRVAFRIETLPLGKFRVLHEFVKCGGDDDVGKAAKDAGVKTFSRVKFGLGGAQVANSAAGAKAIDPTGATLIVPDKLS